MSKYTFEQLIVTAKRLNGMTDAEFDYSLAHDSMPQHYRDRLPAMSAIRWTAVQAVHAANPDIDFDQQDNWTRETELTDQWLDEYAGQLDELVQAAKQQTYSGWSDASVSRNLPIDYLTSE